MKIVFAGTPDFAILPLRALLEGGEVVAVLTQPDRPQGRKGILTPSPVKREALALGLPVLQPERLKSDFAALKALHADLMVTCAYGQILTQEILDIFPLGVWNVHASLLPAYRGAAPIARCIMDGCKRTGVSIMKTDVGLDTGGVLLQEEVAIEETDTAGTLTEKLSVSGAKLIVQAIQKIRAGSYTLTPQGEGFVCKKVARAEIDFSRSASEVSAFIRALSPAPLAFCTVGGLTLNVLFAEKIIESSKEESGTILCAEPKKGLIVKCGEDAVRLSLVQSAGGKIMKDKDFCNGRKVEKGQRFDKPVL